jgi:hypothetical protein
VKFTGLNTSIVVLAEAHNPTILHPAFLHSQGIIPADWKLAADPVCTPAISVVQFSNQVVFTAEINKLMVRDDASREDTTIPDLVLKYINVLPHVHYSAVGINLSGYVECQNANMWLINRFLQQGAGNDDKNKPISSALKLTYPVDNGVLNLSCEAGSVHKVQGQPSVSALLINGNYHTGIGRDRALEETQNAISMFKARLTHFSCFADMIFGLDK